jgi:hypothetical protein
MVSNDDVDHDRTPVPAGWLEQDNVLQGSAPFKTLVKLDHLHFGGARSEEYANPEVVSIRGEGR